MKRLSSGGAVSDDVVDARVGAERGHASLDGVLELSVRDRREARERLCLAHEDDQAASPGTKVLREPVAHDGQFRACDQPAAIAEHTRRLRGERKAGEGGHDRQKGDDPSVTVDERAPRAEQAGSLPAQFGARVLLTGSADLAPRDHSRGVAPTLGFSSGGLWILTACKSTTAFGLRIVLNALNSAEICERCKETTDSCS